MVSVIKAYHQLAPLINNLDAIKPFSMAADLWCCLLTSIIMSAHESQAGGIPMKSNFYHGTYDDIEWRHQLLLRSSAEKAYRYINTCLK